MRFISSVSRRLAVPALLAALAACGGGGGGGAGGGAIVIAGTWMSEADPLERGSLRLDLAALPASTGPLSGTLTLDPGAIVKQVAGTAEYNPGSGNTMIELTGPGVLLQATVVGSVRDSIWVGSYVNGADTGAWHSIVNGVAEAQVQKAFALPAGWGVIDLCYAAGKLYATATEHSGGPSALYEIDPDSGAFTTIPGAPQQPTGIASDGTSVWASQGTSVVTYDPSSWTSTGTVTTSAGPGQLAFHGSSLWFASLFGIRTIATASGVEGSTPVSADRPEGIAFLGDQLWIGYYPAGGDWALVRRFDPVTGALVKSFYAPNRSLDLLGGSGPLAAQGASLWMVSGPALYLLTPP